MGDFERLRMAFGHPSLVPLNLAIHLILIKNMIGCPGGREEAKGKGQENPPINPKAKLSQFLFVTVLTKDENSTGLAVPFVKQH